MKVTKLFAALALPSVLFLATGCEAGGSKSPSGKQSVFQPLPDSTPILKYNGGTVTAKDVNAQLKSQFTQLQEQALEAYKNGAQQILVMRLLEEEAKKQGVDSPQALMQKLTSEVNVTDAQAKEFIKSQGLEKGVPDPSKPGKMKKVTTEEVKAYLTEQEKRQKQQAFVQGLMASAKAETVLEEPRTEIKLSGDEPFRGSKNAKVVITEFSDFQCPFCAKGKAVVDQIHQAYGDKVKIVFKHFPLDFHRQAKPAAVAATCANQQGKFWEVHDKLFDNQRALTDADAITKLVKETGVDMAKFDACFKNPETTAAVDKEIKYAEEVGVNSTPTFFVNGKRVAGALPFEQFKSMIDSELNKM